MLKFNLQSTKPNVTQIVIPSDIGRTTLDHIENVFLKFAGGFTVTAGRSGWRDDTGANVLEPVMVYSIVNLTQSAVETVANVLLYDANPVQSSVYVVSPDGWLCARITAAALCSSALLGLGQPRTTVGNMI